MLSIDIMLAMATHDMLIKQGIIPADPIPYHEINHLNYFFTK